MPTIGIKRDLLFEALGRSYTEKEFDELCFEFGLELDEITSEKRMISKEQGDQKSTGASEDIIYRIEIPANRYDLLCIEGLVQALLIFQEKIKIPRYTTSFDECKKQSLIISKNTKGVRPYAVAAILRDVTFTNDSYNSFIDLQDKLHQNLCRKRSLVAIGTHDLDTIKGPFVYDALPPGEIEFQPLNQAKKVSAVQMMEMYSTDSHLKSYLHIIKDEPLYPVIYDNDGVVLSMPPIINGEHSKITLNTKNVFIECTATDLHKAKVVLDTIVCMFSQYCRKKFTIESVEILNSDNEKIVYPELKYRNEEITVDFINNSLGIRQSADEICKLLNKMSLKSDVIDGNIIKVEIPPSRHDILHSCDIMEDVGVSFGYNNIRKTFPKVNTVGQQLLLHKICDQMRHEISRCCYTEVLTFSLCSTDDLTIKMRKPNSSEMNIVKIANPKTQDFEVARTHLLPGLLKTIQANLKMPLPLKLFEISDVILKDPRNEVGARNERRICAIYYAKTPGFEIIHGLLDRIMQVLQIKFNTENGYTIRHHSDDTFFKGRCAKVLRNGKVVGVMGVLHPEVVANFELTQTCSAFELNIEELSPL